MAAAAISAFAPAAPALAQGEFSIFQLYYELNASAGDVGLHGMLGGDVWSMADILGPGGDVSGRAYASQR